MAFGAAFAVAPRQAEEHQADGLCWRGAAGAGDAGDRDRQVNRGAGEGASRHRCGSLGADGAMSGDRFGNNPQQLRLRLVRVSHEAPFYDVGRTRNRGQCSRDQPAGTGFRGRQPPIAGAAGVENRLRQGQGFSFEHRVLHRRRQRPRTPEERKARPADRQHDAEPAMDPAVGQPYRPRLPVSKIRKSRKAAA